MVWANKVDLNFANKVIKKAQKGKRSTRGNYLAHGLEYFSAFLSNPTKKIVEALHWDSNSPKFLSCYYISVYQRPVYKPIMVSQNSSIPWKFLAPKYVICVYKRIEFLMSSSWVLRLNDMLKTKLNNVLLKCILINLGLDSIGSKKCHFIGGFQKASWLLPRDHWRKKIRFKKLN